MRWNAAILLLQYPAPTPKGKYEDAEALYRLAMEIAEATVGKDHPDYSIRSSNLARLMVNQVRASVVRCTLGTYLGGRDMLPPCWRT